jgi:Mrp family chromosome partitioning ATPase
MVTSLFLGEGASFLARNFARQLADAGKRVALLDLNLYQPSISSVIQQEGAAGFSDFIHGTSENASGFIRPAGDSSLHVMPAGKKADNPVSLFVHPRMDLLFSWLKSNYDFVVMDAPPLELTSEAYALARFCDATLLVARHGVTPKNIIRKLDDNPELKNLRNVNIVLNGIKARGFPRRYYGYGFGYGHEVIPKKQLLKLTRPTQGG